MREPIKNSTPMWVQLDEDEESNLIIGEYFLIFPFPSECLPVENILSVEEIGVESYFE